MRQISEELKSAILQHKEEEFNALLGSSVSTDLVYQLSDLRANVIRQIPIEKTERILEIGSECGAISSYLKDKAGELVCIEPSSAMMELNQHRNAGTENISYICKDAKEALKELEENSFDKIFMIGLDLELDLTIPSFAASLLKKGGQLILAADNKYGLQFFAGNQDEDGRGYFPFEADAQQDSFRLLSHKEIEEVMQAANMAKYDFYYPYPDYRYTTVIYSDQYLPQENELKRSWRNMSKERMVLFDEEGAFRSICKDGLFPVFTNSFLVIGEKHE
jgi:SAM-dependent methyltransferase